MTLTGGLRSAVESVQLTSCAACGDPFTLLDHQLLLPFTHAFSVRHGKLYDGVPNMDSHDPSFLVSWGECWPGEEGTWLATHVVLAGWLA